MQRLIFGSFFGLVFLVACSSDEGGGTKQHVDKGDAGRGADASKPPTKDAGKSDAAAIATTDGGGSAQTTKRALPGDVCTVLQKNGCTSCHKTPTANGAPMALQLSDQFQGKTLDGAPMSERILERVTNKDDPMPPVPYEMMSDDDVAVLKDWLQGGMTAAQGVTPCAPAEGTTQQVTWASNEWPDESECDYVMTLGAHGAVGTPLAMDTTPFPIPAAQTHYECFYEYVPWGDEAVTAIAVRARVETEDDQKYVHHYVVSSSTGLPSVAGQVPLANGDHKPCENPSGSTVGIYAPGAFNPLQYPSDVGVLMPHGSGAYMELQVHYNNPHSDSGKVSRAQYDICVSKKERKNTAGVFWLGYENAFYDTLVSGQESWTRPLDNQGNGVAIGKCSVKEDTRILSIMPHMHERGRHSTVEVVHADGSADTVLDEAFDFENQTSYLQEDLNVKKGDTVRSTCKWVDGPQYFGFGSDQEMCFMYVLAYPLTGLVANPLLGEKGFVGGDLACAAAVGP